MGGSDPRTTDVVVTIFCAAIVMLYAAKRYDTPETNRRSTTKSLFFLTGAGYLATSLILFAMLCETVLKPGFLDFLGLGHAQDVVAKYAYPPVLAAVILTTMLPNVTILRAADDWFLKRFQSWGRIPDGVRHLADKLPMEAHSLRQDRLDDLRQWIGENGRVPNELADRIGATSESTSSGCLTRVLLLYRELEKLEAAQSHISSFRAHADAWRTIRDDLPVFAAESHAFFVLFDELKHVDGAAGEDALKQRGDHYRAICRRLFRQMTEFLAASLLMVDASESRIKRRLATMGFRIEELSCPQVPIGAFVFMGVMMMLAILSVVAIARPDPGKMPLAVTALLIGLTKTVGVLAAIVPKFRWRWFRPDENGRLPYLAWLVSAILALSVSFVVERMSVGILGHRLLSALDFMRFPASPLAPTTFTLCLALAIVCDVNLGLKRGWLYRVAEGMICGATMTATIFVCLQLLEIRSATADQTAAWFPFVFSFSIGFVSGLVAPHLYRRAQAGATPAQATLPRIVEQPPAYEDRGPLGPVDGSERVILDDAVGQEARHRKEKVDIN